MLCTTVEHYFYVFHGALGLPNTSRQFHTAVDVYAFGICTLEVLLEIIDKLGMEIAQAMKFSLPLLRSLWWSGIKYNLSCNMFCPIKT